MTPAGSLKPKTKRPPFSASRLEGTITAITALRRMNPDVSALERAFQLARSGRVASIQDIRAQLKREGYNDRAVEGRSLTSQLRDIIKAAQATQEGH